ncbi:MAG TPA: LacI family DNA-binding transcriptional regulator, partial [Acidimicrobiales bacterium]
MARVTLQTIADRLGVSRMTVSNAFSRPDQLSTELRERVLATARELGYAGPNPVARTLSRGATG